MAENVCPICGNRARLVKADQINKRRHVIVCENEDYIHAMRGYEHIVAHTEKNIKEEPILAAC